MISLGVHSLVQLVLSSQKVRRNLSESSQVYSTTQLARSGHHRVNSSDALVGIKSPFISSHYLQSVSRASYIGDPDVVYHAPGRSAD